MQRERHRSERIGWLRAAVLGANDGIVSTASLIAGVAAAHASHATVVTTGVAGLVAGAMSMAAGEYVSVHSQADTEAADLALERGELERDPQGEQRELKGIYVARGLDPELAQRVAEQLMRRDALAAHARDELGLSPNVRARPVQAALASAASYTAGAALPLAVAIVAAPGALIPWLAVMALVFLALLGAIAARVGGASMAKGAWRVVLWGALAIGITTAVGAMFDTRV